MYSDTKHANIFVGSSSGWCKIYVRAFVRWKGNSDFFADWNFTNKLTKINIIRNRSSPLLVPFLRRHGDSRGARRKTLKSEASALSFAFGILYCQAHCVGTSIPGVASVDLQRRIGGSCGRYERESSWKSAA